MAEPTQEQLAILQLNAQLQQALAERDNATALLGRLTLERDSLLEEIDKLRGEKIALQSRCAEQTRTADKLRQQHQEQQAAKSKEHAETCSQQAEHVRQLSEENRQLKTSNALLRRQCEDLQRQRDDVLARFDSEIRADAAAKAEQAKRERLARLLAEARQLEQDLTPAEGEKSAAGSILAPEQPAPTEPVLQ